MAPPGDITDEFDDDALRESIERAGQDGPWREGDAGFVDPKLEAIRQQLATAAPSRASYAERRLQELQQRAATARPADKESPAGARLDWQQAVVPPQPAEPAPAPPQFVVAAPAASALASIGGPLLAGLAVFVPVAAVHIALLGWQPATPWRVALATLLAGLGWQRFGPERVHPAVLGTAVHLVAFFLSASAWSGRDLVANGIGLAIALAGSTLAAGRLGGRDLPAGRV
ncbi:MAG: hypothetical protein KF830_16205 [Planctomycetes bacterium]|nr:hypothetical protein [Planctomycetota bacterium]